MLLERGVAGGIREVASEILGTFAVVEDCAEVVDLHGSKTSTELESNSALTPSNTRPVGLSEELITSSPSGERLTCW